MFSPIEKISSQTKLLARSRDHWENEVYPDRLALSSASQVPPLTRDIVFDSFYHRQVSSGECLILQIILKFICTWHFQEIVDRVPVKVLATLSFSNKDYWLTQTKYSTNEIIF